MRYYNPDIPYNTGYNASGIRDVGIANLVPYQPKRGGKKHNFTKIKSTSIDNGINKIDFVINTISNKFQDLNNKMAKYDVKIANYLK